MIERIFIFVLGSCVGSFLNVCIYRLPKEASIIKPFSFCPHCKKPIRWYDNIPLISYLVLRAKCRDCQGPISWRYPFVELLTAVLFIALFNMFGFTLLFWQFAFFFSLSMMISFIDIDYHAIPAYLCFFGIIVGLLLSVVRSIDDLQSVMLDIKALPVAEALGGLVVGFGFTYAFKFFGDIGMNLYLSLRKKESIEGERESLGLGDVDFMGMVGVFLGVQQAIFVFFLAPFIAIVYSIFALIFKKSHLIPYLPYLSLATLVVFFWGRDILSIIF